MYLWCITLFLRIISRRAINKLRTSLAGYRVPRYMNLASEEPRLAPASAWSVSGLWVYTGDSATH